MEQLVILALFLGVMYFVLIRPQQKQQKRRAQMLQQIEVGSDVVTIGGLHGRVEAMDDDGDESTVDLLVTDDVILRFRRSAIAEVKGELAPVVDDDDESAADA